MPSIVTKIRLWKIKLYPSETGVRPVSLFIPLTDLITSLYNDKLA
ncbi:Uncharacterised protein [Serratia quinivorans]|nr:Uncharacterised protein [Serratia quinivorans]CAI1081991.1 Uncharacterised protein [Serratia quinivorans]CAI1131047.1 Uncharacterised protein [Serratia quinivorans]CAI1584175.1 Uncharacterised protein [Serratia quinivorans]CAI2077188.1 Uncharacterised protein [Serratia quinivorans]